MMNIIYHKKLYRLLPFIMLLPLVQVSGVIYYQVNGERKTVTSWNGMTVDQLKRQIENEKNVKVKNLSFNGRVLTTGMLSGLVNEGNIIIVDVKSDYVGMVTLTEVISNTPYKKKEAELINGNVDYWVRNKCNYSLNTDKEGVWLKLKPNKPLKDQVSPSLLQKDSEIELATLPQDLNINAAQQERIRTLQMTRNILIVLLLMTLVLAPMLGYLIAMNMNKPTQSNIALNSHKEDRQITSESEKTENPFKVTGKR